MSSAKISHLVLRCSLHQGFLAGASLIALAIQTTAALGSTPFVDFFVNSQQQVMSGLSCSSTKECQEQCGGTELCQKPVQTCLNCIGSQSPDLNDLFSNIGDMTTACFNQDLAPSLSPALFENMNLVPITPASSYNPLGLKDAGLTLKFMTLCPSATLEPTAIAITDPLTHGILDIPLIKCGKALFPIVRLNEDCAEKTSRLQKQIQLALDTNQKAKAAYTKAIASAEALALRYEILKLSDYTEGHYLKCDTNSAAVCQAICHSSLSCSLAINGFGTRNAISQFNRTGWTSCGIERFSAEVLVDYLQDPHTFAFTYQSLYQSYDAPVPSGDFTDLTVINTILDDFSGVFVSAENSKDPSDSSFFVSNAYREKLQKKMATYCDGNTDPIILGKGNRIERVFCHSDLNGYFQVLAQPGETCEAKSQSVFHGGV